MSFVPGSTYHFKWKDFELLAVCEGDYQGQPMFRERESGLRFSLNDAGSPKIKEYDEGADALENFKPDLTKFAPTFMGFRKKEK